MADETAKAKPTTDEAPQASEMVKARLLARYWMQPIVEAKTGKILNHQRVMQGQIVEIPRHMLDGLNEFKPSFEEVTE